MPAGKSPPDIRRRLLLGVGASPFQISCLRPKFLPAHAALARPAMEISMSVVSRLRSFAIATLLGLSVASCGYNTIPTLEENAKAKWAEVQAQYQRRADLIPNLVATVQGYAKQEKDVLTQVAEARAKATQIKVDASSLTDPDKVKQFQDAQAQLSGALGRLLAVSEAYPDLKSNANFLALQSQLEGTENRINVARRDYIEAARDFNVALRTFPTVLWAKTFFTSEKPLAEFTASDAAQGAPQVKF
jgi:LemA protein